MKKLSKSEMKKIIGGDGSMYNLIEYSETPSSICSVDCGGGNFKSHNCGTGTMCNTTGDGGVNCTSNNGTVTKHCPCD